MHRAGLVLALATVIAMGLGSPGSVRAAADPGDWYDDPIEDADVVLIGRAQDVRPGRVVNRCQPTHAP